MRYSYIFFDLDGTISDPREGIMNSVSYALNKMKVDEFNSETLLRFIGPPLKYSFRTFFSFSDAETKLIQNGAIYHSRVFD